VKKISTVAKCGNEIFEEPKLTIVWIWETSNPLLHLG